ncbi:unnamed protein product [Owenia fusiformis]|uniref:Uncharacterized protein n=1 Tax=Owenia fusiformis TaxID=6347 RepID=A0A8S4MX82_OWEFU|nr:unnamed protein product [Owenia fusiformis]
MDVEEESYNTFSSPFLSKSLSMALNARRKRLREDIRQNYRDQLLNRVDNLLTKLNKERGDPGERDQQKEQETNDNSDVESQADSVGPAESEVTLPMLTDRENTMVSTGGMKEQCNSQEQCKKSPSSAAIKASTPSTMYTPRNARTSPPKPNSATTKSRRPSTQSPGFPRENIVNNMKVQYICVLTFNAQVEIVITKVSMIPGNDPLECDKKT